MELCCSTRRSRRGCGFSPCGSSPARRTASARWVCSGCSAWAAMRRPGPGYISYAGRWSAPAATVSPADRDRRDIRWRPGRGQTRTPNRGQGHCRRGGREKWSWHWPHPPAPCRGRIGVQAVAVPGSTIHTDGWGGYARVPTLGYQHQVTVISGGSDPAHVVMPRVHNAASLLKRWLIGTHQGGIQLQHLDYYLDEFTFRFNRRRSQARGLLFHRLVQQAVASGPAPYHQIIAANEPAPALEAT